MVVAVKVAAEILMAAVLIASGAGKLFAPATFATSLGTTVGTTSSVLNSSIARLIAVVELVIALGAIFFPSVAIVDVSAALLGLGIIVFAAVAIRRRVNVPCGCFGATTGKPLSRRNIVYGSAFVVAGGFLLFTPGPLEPASTDLAATCLLLSSSLALLSALALRKRQWSGLIIQGFGRDQ